MGRFRLRYQTIDVGVGDEDFVAGRVPECDLVLDDSLVSRKHASFRVVGDEVEVRDLGSRNGVTVNGTRIAEPTRLRHGDRVRIGSQELVVKDIERAHSAAGTAELLLCSGCGGMTPASQPECQVCGRPIVTPLPSGAPTETHPLADAPAARAAGPFHALTQLADKALGLGRLEEAERILSSMLATVRSRASGAPGAPADRDALAQACRYALRLAVAMQKRAWLDYPFELYTALGQLMPMELIDELDRVVAKLRYTNSRAVRTYLARLKADAAQLGPTDRFLLLRLEGLERRVVNA
ncbi:MAG TPA: FHA domain-containing protein [Polyangiales bacterium]